jgi:type I restriction enzyme S subunit
VSKVNELLSELCPDGVRHVPLNEVGNFVRGQGLQKVDFTETGVPCIHYGQIYTHYKKYVRETKSFVSPQLAVKLKSAPSGSLIITTTSENVTDVAKCVVWLGEGNVSFGGHSCALIHDQNPMYIAHVLETSEFQFQKNALTQGTKVKDISLAKLGSIKIPLPPRKVQDEIAKNLDMFQDLEAELEAALEAELEARRTQYEFYRSQLLSPTNKDPDTRVVPLGSLLKLQAGKSVSASEINQIADGAHVFPCYGGNGQRGYVPNFSHDGDYVLIGRQGALSGNIKRTSGKFYATEHAIVATPKELCDINWLYHTLIEMNLNQFVSRGAQPGLAVGNLETVEIAVPSPEKQKQIGATIEGFNKLVNEISSRLPAEIAARRQQYEHYRTRLLTFKEIDVA